MLQRPAAGIRPISVVPLVDVLLILLVFFMVTSTYLDLDTVPVSEAASDAPAPAAAASTLLVRIGADGSLATGGRTLAPGDLAAVLAERLAADPDLALVLLPSPRAKVQALVTAMDGATLAGATRIRVLRLAEP
jgi:biopolymer transport protein ExbD